MRYFIQIQSESPAVIMMFTHTFSSRPGDQKGLAFNGVGAEKERTFSTNDERGTMTDGVFTVSRLAVGTARTARTGILKMAARNLILNLLARGGCSSSEGVTHSGVVFKHSSLYYVILELKMAPIILTRFRVIRDEQLTSLALRIDINSCSKRRRLHSATP